MTELMATVAGTATLLVLEVLVMVRLTGRLRTLLLGDTQPTRGGSMTSRRIAYALAGALAVAVVVALVTKTGAAAPRPDNPPRVSLGGLDAAFYSSDTGPCPGARRGLAWYRARYAEHRRAQRLAGPVELVRYGCDATRRRAVEWRARAARERERAADWRRYHFAWREWLPRNWYVVGSCETGYGGAPNWSHANSSYVSAFGISRREYDADAAFMGAPPWNDARPPTPREQLLAAIGHYRRFGDGWTCPGP